MPLKKLGKISLASSLFALTVMTSGLAANADTVIIEQSPAVVEREIQVVQPQAIEKRTVIEQRSVTAPAEALVLPAPAYVESEPTTLIESRSVVTNGTITGPDPATGVVKVEGVQPKTTLTSESSVETAPRPAYIKRLQSMRDQVELGLSRGYMTQAQADSLKFRLDSLDREAADLLATGTEKTMSDALEKKVTRLNMDIANAMADQQVGSGAQTQ